MCQRLLAPSRALLPRVFFPPSGSRVFSPRPFWVGSSPPAPLWAVVVGHHAGACAMLEFELVTARGIYRPGSASCQWPGCGCCVVVINLLTDRHVQPSFSTISSISIRSCFPYFFRLGGNRKIKRPHGDSFRKFSGPS